MNRQQFNSRNDIGQVLTFQKSGSTASFDPTINFSSGTRRVSWRLTNGSNTELIAGNTLLYTGFTSDNGIRTVKMNSNNFKNISNILFDSDQIYGHLDLSPFDNLLANNSNIIFNNNSLITGLTAPTLTTSVTNFAFQSCNITGNLNLTNISGNIGSLNISQNSNLTGVTFNGSTRIAQIIANSSNITGNFYAPFSGVTFQIFSNPNLTGITHTPSSANISFYQAQACNLTNNLDLTPLSGLGNVVTLSVNPNLTGITNPTSPNNINTYTINNCNITGVLDMTPLSGIGGNFYFFSNPNLTNVLHAPSNKVFTGYVGYSCNLTDNFDLTPLSGIGGQILLGSNPNLTGVTYSNVQNTFSSYSLVNCNLIGNHYIPFSADVNASIALTNNVLLTGITITPTINELLSFEAYNCDLTNNLDLTVFSAFTKSLQLQNNVNLTGVTISPNTSYTNLIDLTSCDLNGTIDLSPISNLGRQTSGGTDGVRVRINSNTNLTDIIFPTTTSFFKNQTNSETNGCFSLFSNSLNYIDFKPLSGATFLTGATNGNPRISLRDNNMVASDVNHILVDFSGNATYNPTGWSNINLNIGGTNADPDSLSGGYNGLAAISFLTGSPYNWTITY